MRSCPRSGWEGDDLAKNAIHKKTSYLNMQEEEREGKDKTGGRGNEKVQNSLASEASSRAEGKGLAGLLNVMAGGVKPAVRTEEHGFLEILGVVSDSPSACVELGLYGRRKSQRKTYAQTGPSQLRLETKIFPKRVHPCGVGKGG